MKFELGPGLKCDLQKLIDTRALVQANSGGGKSHTLRRLLEQTHGHVQQLVIDPEGEFASLRERYDYVLAAKSGGDTAADPRAAKLLAERLLELGVSAILDIYELKAHERIRFVRAFLEALVDAPKTLWHPALVVVDEAHVFCPQQGEAESAGAVIDLCTRGRKRGFSAVLATQRLSKLHKDAAAELNNKLIGRTGLDVDRKRAGEELGFTTKEQLLSLRALEPGHFYAFGPALSLEVKEVQVGPVETTHPKAGSRIAFTPPPPTEKVKALLPQLADLPAEAEHKAKSEADLKKELAAARATITRLERAAPVQTSAPDRATAAELRQARVDGHALEQRAQQLTSAAEQLMKFILEINAQDFFTAGAEKIDPAAIQKAIDGAAQQLLRLVESDLRARRQAFERWRKDGEQLLAKMGRLVKQDVKVTVAVKHNAPFTVSPPARPAARSRVEAIEGAGGPLKAGARRMLEQLATWHPRGLQRSELGVLAGVQSGGGTFSDYLSALRKNGFIEERGSVISATEAGLAAAGDVPHPHSTDEIVAIYRSKLKAGARRMLDILVARYPDGITRRDLGAESGVDASGGTFSDYLSSLRSAGLLDESQGDLRAAAILFAEIGA